jgi:nanoRNase/pAp phosphatase (c-di-AMP/oligoRNAs hydrolase)
MAEVSDKFRLVTRSDFDGLVCAVLLKELDAVDEIKFVHPKDVQDGLIDMGENDITANLPYDRRVQRAFDHHVSETIRLEHMPLNYVNNPKAPSAARVVYDYYGGRTAFPHVSEELMRAVDQADSAQFTMEEVLNPTGWALLNFIMDSRTGLGRFRSFRTSNYKLMMELIELCRDRPIEEILKHPDVKERIDLLNIQRDKFIAQIRRCATVHKNLVVLDLREEKLIYCGNRFMIYALYPETNVSMYCIWGVKKMNTVFPVGKSIFNRTCNTNIGALMLDYGGGGHDGAGTCQVPNADAERVKNELIEKLVAAG